MKGALDVHRTLLALDVPHEVVRLPTRVPTADHLPRVLQLDRGCVTVRCYEVAGPGAAADGRRVVAVLVPAGRHPDPAALRAVLGAPVVREARPAVVNAVTDFAAGLVSPVGLPEDLEVLADRAVTEADVSYCAVGEGGTALGIRTADLLAVTRAVPVPLTQPEPYAGSASRSVPVGARESAAGGRGGLRSGV